MPYTVSKQFKVDVAERNWIKGKASALIRGKELYDVSVMCPEFQIHGHTLYFDITLQSDKLDDPGFILDTDVLKELMKEKVKQLDHCLLIHKEDPIYPTMVDLAKEHPIKIYATDYVISYEHISKDLYDFCAKQLKKHGLDKFVKLKSVRVYTRTIGGSYFTD